VLVHCVVGKSRSPTIVISYLMKTNKWNLRQAFEHVKKARIIVDPNYGFMHQLMELDLKLFNEASLTPNGWNTLRKELNQYKNPSVKNTTNTTTANIKDYDMDINQWVEDRVTNDVLSQVYIEFTADNKSNALSRTKEFVQFVNTYVQKKYSSELFDLKFNLKRLAFPINKKASIWFTSKYVENIG